MNLIFPVAVMANTFAMTVLMILLGLSGESHLAADIGIVHGATLALFFAFSANARSLILNKPLNIQAKFIMFARLLLVVPLAGVSYLLSVTGGVEAGLALVLIVRRCGEWLSEVHLSDIERQDHKGQAEFYVAAQAALLVLAFGWIWFDIPQPLLGLWAWALAPFLFSFKDILKSLAGAFGSRSGLSFNLIPHFGSSAIIGISVYVFRLLIVFILGKAVAGDLFTAFAIGGMVGSVFANALGATITLHEQRSGKRHFPSFLRWTIYASMIIGVTLYIAASIPFPVLEASGKSLFFWRAVGLSLIGGVVMVYAQRIRFRIMQGDEEHDVFGSDVIMNVLLLGAVPFAYFLLGIEAMAALYLLSALLAFVFYQSAAKEGMLSHLPGYLKDQLSIIIPFALLFPIFFQIANGLFQNPAFNFNSGGKLINLPIPLSVSACYLGIVILGGYRRAFIAYMTIFLICILMVMATIISASSNSTNHEAKLILLLQFILPMFALALGQAFSYEYKENKYKLARGFLYVLIVIVPLQLLVSWIEGYPFLVPSVGLFSIYQSLQYVPSILISAFLIALFSLWQSPGWRKTLFILLPIMAIYAAASISMLTWGMFLIGILIFGGLQWVLKREKFPLILFLIAAILSSGYLHYQKNVIGYKFTFLLEASQKATLGPGAAEEVIPPNLSQRLGYWKYYLKGISTSPKIFLWGQKLPPDRTRYPSAHNYYLDFIYNFGFLALLPLLTLLILTATIVCRNLREIFSTPSLAGLSFVVLFLLILDNSLKVGLRQPYPGIFTFFLWGVLLTRLLVMNRDKN